MQFVTDDTWNDEVEDYSTEYYWPLPCQQDNMSNHEFNNRIILYSLVIQIALLILAIILLFCSCYQLFYYYRIRKINTNKVGNFMEEFDDDITASNDDIDSGKYYTLI